MQRTARVTMLAVEVTNSTDVVERSTTSVSTAKRLADTATCEPTSCTSSSFGRNVFLATLGAEETQSFCPTISTAREQTISVAKRAEGTCRRIPPPKSERVRRVGYRLPL
jgi:hypothetical protein